MAKRVVAKIKLCYKGKCKEVEALFDTGATVSCVSEKFARNFEYIDYEKEGRKPWEVPLAVKNKKGLVIGDLYAWVEIEGCEIPDSLKFRVVKDLARDVIIGMDAIELYDIVLDTKRGRVYLKSCPPELHLF